LEQSKTELNIILPIVLQKCLSEQFERLLDLEKQILYFLAIYQQPVPLEKLKISLNCEIYLSSLTQALISLRRRSLLEVASEGNQTSFILQPMVTKYIIREYKDECDHFKKFWQH
jgi:hypothetical protein